MNRSNPISPTAMAVVADNMCTSFMLRDPGTVELDHEAPPSVVLKATPEAPTMTPAVAPSRDGYFRIHDFEWCATHGMHLAPL